MPPAALIAAAAGMQPASCSGPKLASGPLKGLKTANVSGPVPEPPLAELCEPHAASPRSREGTARRAALLFVAVTREDRSIWERFRSHVYRRVLAKFTAIPG